MADEMARRPAPHGPSRGWKVVLALSLALNLAVIGMVAGFAWRLKDGERPRGFDFALGPVTQALTREDRRAIGMALRNDRTLRPPRRDEPDALAADLAMALRADPFDRAAFEEALAAPAARMQGVQAAARAALVERIAQMTPAERSAFADRLATAARDWQRRP